MKRTIGALILLIILISAPTACSRTVEGTAQAIASTATPEQSPTSTTPSPNTPNEGLCKIPQNVATALNVDKSTAERSAKSTTRLLDDCAWRGPDFQLQIASYDLDAAAFAENLATESSAGSMRTTIGTHQAFILTQSEDEFEPDCAIILDMTDHSVVIMIDDDTYISRSSNCSRLRIAAAAVEAQLN